MHMLHHHGLLVVLSSASPLEKQGVPCCSLAKGSRGSVYFSFQIWSVVQAIHYFVRSTTLHWLQLLKNRNTWMKFIVCFLWREIEWILQSVVVLLSGFILLFSLQRRWSDAVRLHAQLLNFVVAEICTSFWKTEVCVAHRIFCGSTGGDYKFCMCVSV